MNRNRIRTTYEIKGIVQGVGFRPTLCRLARQAALSGWVQNRTGSVRLVLEGAPAAVDAFIRDLPANLPPNARIDSIVRTGSDFLTSSAIAREFFIAPSSSEDVRDFTVPPDLAICPDCSREIMDPCDRRFRHPFATCTNCGPRYTVIRSVPYDRERTTMSVFSLCPKCRKEYKDPVNRRFHAETIACHNCGPKLSIEGANHRHLPGNPLKIARTAISKGGIVALKGVGGFLLAADPFNRKTIETLRKRKNRPHKPFAVMARNLDVVKKICVVPPIAEELLDSPEAPIVILDLKDKAEGLALDLITPDAKTLGVMLPTSPLHRLIMEKGPDDPAPSFDLLIMTSGNRRSEPVCVTSAEARDRLTGIADMYLLHNREISLRNDDSLCIIQSGKPQVWRRARGFAPAPIALASCLKRTVLAMGAEIKNTVAVGFENKVVISPHVGDLETPEAIDGMRTVAERLPEFLKRQPDTIAVDLHPDMHSTRYGKERALSTGVKLVEVQHHHAHAAACLAEHGLDSGLAIVFDGAGLGADGTIWGSELIEMSPSGFKRLAAFDSVPLPGGDAAVSRPARQVIGRFAGYGIPATQEWRDRLKITDEETMVWTDQCANGLNSPSSNSAGRLFDSFSAMLGIAPDRISYEGQPAIRLESAAAQCREEPVPILPFATRESGGMLVVNWNKAFVMLSDIKTMKGREITWAMAAHRTVAQAIRTMVEYGLSKSRHRHIALSGGVFMNRILNNLVVPELEKLGLKVLLHSLTPPNDGCISFGQAVIAGNRDMKDGN